MSPRFAGFMKRITHNPRSMAFRLLTGLAALLLGFIPAAASGEAARTALLRGRAAMEDTG